MGNFSQWIPPLGVAGGLGQHVRKGGEEFENNPAGSKEGRRLESDLLAFRASILLQVIGGVRGGRDPVAAGGSLLGVGRCGGGPGHR